MTDLRTFWDFLWCRPGLAATANEWKQVLGEKVWEVLRKRLFVADGIAEICADVEGRRLQVVRTSNGKYGLATTTGEFIAKELNEADVRAYQLNASTLRDVIGDALGITTDYGEVTELPKAFPLGEWRPLDSVAIPVYLMLPPTTTLLSSEIQRLLLEVSGGFLLLLPQRYRLDAKLREQLERRQVAVIVLPEVVAWNGEQFCATPGWDRHRDAYCTKHYAERMTPAPPLYEFRKTGDYWTVRFNGESTIIKDAVGLSYIIYLLARPHEKVFAPDLLGAVSGEAVSKHAGDAGDLTDQQTEEESKQRLLEIQEELDEADQNNDLAAKSRLQKEEEGILSYFRTVKGYGGRTRKGSDAVDSIRRSVQQAIQRVKIDFAKPGKLPKFATHLENALNTGLFISYNPEEELPWNI